MYLSISDFNGRVLSKKIEETDDGVYIYESIYGFHFIIVAGVYLNRNDRDVNDILKKNGDYGKYLDIPTRKFINHVKKEYNGIVVPDNALGFSTMFFKNKDDMMRAIEWIKNILLMKILAN